MSFSHRQVSFSDKNDGNGVYLIIAYSHIYDSIYSDIETYVDDIVSHTEFKVAVEVVSGGSHKDIRLLLKYYYNHNSVPHLKTDDTLRGALLVGDIRPALFESEIDIEDISNGNGTNTHRKYQMWPCDLYYMDLDGDWGDNHDLSYLDGTYTDFIWVNRKNTIFDTHTGNVEPEIFVGRLNGAHLGIGRDVEGSLDFESRKEVNALRRYFHKNHQYWSMPKKYRYNYLSYIDHDWNDYIEMKNVRLIYGDSSHFSNCNDPFANDTSTSETSGEEQRSDMDMIKKNIEIINRNSSAFDSLHFGAKNYKELIQDPELGYLFVAVHSAPTYHGFLSPYMYYDSQNNQVIIWHQVDSNQVWSDHIYNDTISTHFIGANLFACSACDWTRADDTIGYLGGSYLFGLNNDCLALTGSTKSGSMMRNYRYFYGPLGQGKSIGQSYLDWWKSFRIDTTTSSYSTIDMLHHYGMTLMGDPLVSMVDSSIDLYVADTVSDNGYEPSSVRYMYNSPDIWVENDGGACIEHPIGGMTNKVCVRIHNRSFRPTTGNETLIVNWAKAGLNIPWPSGWDGKDKYPICGNGGVYMGGLVDSVTIGPIPAYGDTVIKVNWRVPDVADYDCGMFSRLGELWHFCLLARIHDGNMIVGENVNGYPMDSLVLNNNNVAWKNLTVLHGESYLGMVSLYNSSLKDDLDSRIEVRLIDNDSRQHLLDFAELQLILPTEMTINWADNDGTCDGLKLSRDRSYFNVVSSASQINHFVIRPKEYIPLIVKLSFLADTLPADSTFGVVVEHWSGDLLLGGEYFQVIRNMGRGFSSGIIGNTYLLPSQSTTLTADDIMEPANYLWHDASGNVIQEGQELIVSPSNTQRYTLEVTAESDGYKDYSEVTAVVTHGAITSISPNPANSMATVSYSISEEVSSAYVAIRTSVGNNMRIASVNGQNGEVAFDLQGIPAGHYRVILMDRMGETLDSKSIIIF